MLYPFTIFFADPSHTAIDLLKNEVRQMAADGRVVAEGFILRDWLAAAHCVEEIGFVISHVVIACRGGVGFDFLIHMRSQGRGPRMPRATASDTAPAMRAASR